MEHIQLFKFSEEISKKMKKREKREQKEKKEKNFLLREANLT